MSLFFLLIFLSTTCFKPSSSIILCPLIEKHSLLSFKQSLQDPNHELSSWDDELNCCKWKGVVCNNSTGHVHQLHLHGLKGQINPSLLKLTHLTSLDLSLNDFGPAIPSFIGSFPNLQHLNLSFAGFFGKIPHSLGNLSYLLSLDLAGFPHMAVAYLVKYPNILDVDSLEWLSGVSKLEYLNMNFANLGKATNWVQVINTLPSLLQLNLHDCSIGYIAPMLPVMNITSLTFLDLSYNNFHSFAVPTWIFRLNSLLYLNLCNNSFIGPIPTVSNLTKLQFIDLSFNLLNSTIPSWLCSCIDLGFVSLGNNLLHGKIPTELTNLCKIRELLLSGNNFDEKMSDSFGHMSECFLGSLEVLDLSVNKLSGNLIDEFGEFKSLQVLFLNLNSLSGRIPINLGKLSSLKHLGVAGNQFTGNLPHSLGQLSNLERLYISGNKLEGVVTESFFANLTKLELMSASYNHLTLKVSQHWIPPLQLKSLALGSWNLGEGSQIPAWLHQTHKSILILDLSNTGISGSVPNWFWHVRYLNLSHNRLHGKIPDLHGSKDLDLLYLSSNRFEGSLPRVGDSLRELDLSNNSLSGGISNFLCEGTHHAYALEILHLGENKLSGELPDCWKKWPSLTYLSLANNDMFGNIPSSMGFLAKIQSLNLDINNFSGGIPFSMHNCTKLVKIGLENNNLGGNIPRWIGRRLVELRILILRSNNFSGEICSEICHLRSLQILDLSNNKLSGIIPRCLHYFTAMASKRSLPDPFRSLHIPFGVFDMEASFYFSSVQIGGFKESALIVKKGSEMLYGTILPLVTCIDLSMNNLSGEIPSELTRLLELGSLNLSRNHLTGVIPENIGDMKQLESLDLSRNSLWGRIPNSLALISTLDYLDLSYNNLTGRIPKSTQLQSFDASCFTGNNLCGPPLTSNCSGDGDGDGDRQKGMNEGEDHKPEIEWFYLLLTLGYAMGFSVVCTTLVLNKPWRRDAYFGLLGWMRNQLYVYATIKWTRLTTPSGSS